MDYQMSFSCFFNTFYMWYLKVLLDGCMVDVVDIPLWIGWLYAYNDTLSFRCLRKYDKTLVKCRPKSCNATFT